MKRVGLVQVVCAALILALGGCAAVEQAPVVSTDATAHLAEQQRRDAALMRLAGWNFAGKVHVKGNERPGNVEINWIDRGAVSDITLSGPGGFNASTLEVAPGLVVLRRSNGQVVEADNPDELVAKLVGWPMPLSLLSDWVLGLPGEASVLARDAQARLETAQYREWTGEFSRYRLVDGLAMPHRIDITDGHLNVSVRPRQWSLVPETAPQPSRRIPIPGLGS